MTRKLILLIPFLLSACASAPAGGAMPFVVDWASVGFAQIRIGMPHAQAESALKRQLPIVESFNEACGRGFTETTIAERKVRVQWADEGEREIEAIFVELPLSELPIARSTLEELFRRHGGPCGTETSEHLVGCFRHPKGIVVLAESQPAYSGIRIISDDCTD